MAISVNRAMPRQTAVFPGGGSWARSNGRDEHRLPIQLRGCWAVDDTLLDG